MVGQCGIIPNIGDIMTLLELEIRVATLEQKLALLAGKVDAPEASHINAWIENVHGTFQNDATYRQAARLGYEWRRSQRVRAESRARRNAGK
jgi:hypothetical protein